MEYKKKNFTTYGCDGCDVYKKKKEMKVCSKCRHARYCNKTCQVRDWRRHKVNCRSEYKQAKQIIKAITKTFLRTQQQIILDRCVSSLGKQRRILHIWYHGPITTPIDDGIFTVGVDGAIQKFFMEANLKNFQHLDTLKITSCTHMARTHDLVPQFVCVSSIANSQGQSP